MSRTFSTVLREHFVRNIAIYFVIILAFTIGVCTGAFTVNVLDYNQYDELSNYIKDFFSIIQGQDINHTELFKTSIYNNLKMVLLLSILGVTVIGIPLVLIIIGIKGFVIGFTVGFLVKVLDLKGVFFSLLGILPQNLIIIPCYIFLGFLCIDFSISMVRSRTRAKYRKEDIKTQLLTYGSFLLIIFLLLVAGSVVEAYITPVFIKMMISTFIV